jgi:hypothetical protein
MPERQYYDVDCDTDGYQCVWSDVEPTECPLDSAHSVTKVVAHSGDGSPVRGALYLSDGAGRSFEITVDQNGVLSTSQISGPPPV